MKKYFLYNDKKYIPQFGDELEDISNRESECTGISFSSFENLIKNHDQMDLFFKICVCGSGGQGGFDVIHYGYYPEKPENECLRKKHETLKHFLLRVAVDAGLLTCKEISFFKKYVR